TLRGLAGRWQADPARREEVEERFQLLRRLETKYGKSIDALIAYRAGLDEQEKHLQGAEDEREALEAEIAKVFAELRRAGGELSKQREKVARRFVNEVRKHLADLGMADAQLDDALTPVPLGDDPATAELPAHGLEQLELMQTANKGEPAPPFRTVASGGEQSGPI